MGADDKFSNAAQEAAGKVKEGLGKVTDNERLEAEGKADQVEADVKQAGEKIKDVFDRADVDYFRERRSDVDFVGERVIRRVTVLGDPPEGPGPRWEPFAATRASTASRYDAPLRRHLREANR